MKQINTMLTIGTAVPPKTPNVGTSSVGKGFQRLLHNQLDSKVELETKAKPSNFGKDKLASLAKPNSFKDVSNRAHSRKMNVGSDESKVVSSEKKTNRSPEQAGEVKAGAAALNEEIAKLLADGTLSKEDLAQISELVDQVAALAQMQDLLVQLQAILAQVQSLMQNPDTTVPTAEISSQPNDSNIQQLLKVLDKFAQNQTMSSLATASNEQLTSSLTTIGLELQQLVAQMDTVDPQQLSNQVNTLVGGLQQLLSKMTDESGQVLAQADQLIQQLALTAGPESQLVQHLQQVTQGTKATLHQLVNAQTSGDVDPESTHKLVAKVAVLQEVLATQSQTTNNLSIDGLPEYTVINSGAISPGSGNLDAQTGDQGDADSAQEQIEDLVKGKQTKETTTEGLSGPHREVNVPFKVMMETAEPVNPGAPQIVNPKELAQLSQIKQQVLTPRLQEDIWNQVVEKATLITAGKETDMIIKLKPEHLGKVSLQVSMENGILTAKFTAESRMVKEVIEANINNLKQNLTNQGIKVDQLSVQVGNDGGQPQWSRQSNQNQSAGRGNRSNRGGQQIDGVNASEEATEAPEYGGHLVEEGTVNYVI